MRRRRTLLTAVVCAGAIQPTAAVHADWIEPLDNSGSGAVEAGFDYDRSAPFTRGARRGADVAGRPGAPVLAVCAGRVTHAGPIPARGHGVTLRCGEMIATELGLASTSVRRGQLVRAGVVVGRLGAGGALRLGARRADDRWGYVDPMRLIGPAQEAPPTLGPAPRGGPRRGPVRFGAPPRWKPRAAPVRDPSGVPLSAWIALGAVAASIGGAAWGTRGSSVGRRWGPSTSPRRSTM